MSAIYFTDEHGEAVLRGSERAYMGLFIEDLTAGVFKTLGGDGWIDQFLPAGTRNLYLGRDRKWFLKGDIDLTVDGKTVNMWIVNLNTAIAAGGDAVKLMARLHGQCELHCWVDSFNRAWLAQIIRTGRAHGVLRANQGWEGVADFLDARSDSPVVCSYSVCDHFPSPDMFPKRHPVRRNNALAFYELDPAEKWRICFDALRASGGGLEMAPWDWDDFRFTPRYSIQSLERPSHQGGRMTMETRCGICRHYDDTMYHHAEDDAPEDHLADCLWPTESLPHSLRDGARMRNAVTPNQGADCKCWEVGGIDAP